MLIQVTLANAPVEQLEQPTPVVHQVPATMRIEFGPFKRIPIQIAVKQTRVKVDAEWLSPTPPNGSTTDLNELSKIR